MSPVGVAAREMLCVYAVIPRADGTGLSLGRGRRLFEVADIAAVAGRAPGGADLERRALAHDRIVTRVLDACSAVVPFRLDAILPGRVAVTRVLEKNLDPLTRLLRRFEGKVEMGLKIRLSKDPSEPVGPRPDTALSRRLAAIHRLTSCPEDRREHVRSSPAGLVFEGAYLVKRSRVDDFWTRGEALRDAMPDAPMLASGPFAPYSFCGWLHRETVV